MTDIGEESCELTDELYCGDEDSEYAALDAQRQKKKKSGHGEKQSKICVTVSVLLILFMGALAIVFQRGLFSRYQEQESKHSFTLFTNAIEDSIKDNIRSILNANRVLAQAITTIAMTHNQTFPYVAIPAFEVYAHEARMTGSAIESLVYAPVATDLYKWRKFSILQASWIYESRQIYDRLEPGLDLSQGKQPTSAQPIVWGFADDGSLVPWKKDNETFLPSMYTSPPPFTGIAAQHINLFTDTDYKAISSASSALKDTVFSRFKLKFGQISDMNLGVQGHQHFHNRIHGVDKNSEREELNRNLQPHSLAAHPVYRELGAFATDVVGYIFSVIAWDICLTNLLPTGVSGIIAVLSNTCKQQVTYVLDGHEVFYVGTGDLHDSAYDDQRRTVTLSERYLDPELATEVNGHCELYLDLYPSEEFVNGTGSDVTVFWIAILFVFVAILFIVYDQFVQRHNSKVLDKAARSNAIVASLFPQGVRDRLMEERAESHDTHQSVKQRRASHASLNNFLTNHASAPIVDEDSDDSASSEDDTFNADDKAFGTKPIADLFPETTIMFGDIVGFTAWSSVKEPAQVFTLLETVYLAFDEIAKRKRVFKVETIGDCYVAVCGLPDPCKEHAVNMCLFAGACMKKMKQVTTNLEVKLGPTTGDLSMRIGLHSGPVTAGVLRGERARFQLFGDTMNTASRMESTGKPGCIHLSRDTADILIASGKEKWVRPRDDEVFVKGKGTMQTFFLNLADSSSTDKPRRFSKSTVASESCNEESSANFTNDNEGAEQDPDTEIINIRTKTFKLVRWNVEVLTGLLKQIVARRAASKQGDRKSGSDPERRSSFSGPDKRTSISVSGQEKRKSFSGMFELMKQGHNSFASLLDDSSFSGSSSEFDENYKTVLEEVAEIISLPQFDAKAAKRQTPADLIKLPDDVTKQLQEFVSTISFMYHDNPFHNFDHASHVTSSVVKLLSRIVTPSDLYLSEDADAATLHDHTYGITSDPLTQFSCVLSALIHDLDHPGVPNAQLVKEQDELAMKYKDKSVAEQNSVDISWNLLMEERYSDLRTTICANQTELKRFRQLVVNSVMATDIVDKELKALRNARWDKAFSSQDNEEECVQLAVNRKATIVIEHLIQASDVSHTMQHWHVYRKWNELFFEECYKSYKMGRAATDPSESWYNGEKGFFDFYIIPLAKKLKDCGVFGVSSDEYLNYAIQNRREWEDKGQDIVKEMIQKMKEKEKEWEREAMIEGWLAAEEDEPSPSEETVPVQVGPRLVRERSKSMSFSWKGDRTTVTPAMRSLSADKGKSVRLSWKVEGDTLRPFSPGKSKSMRLNWTGEQNTVTPPLHPFSVERSKSMSLSWTGDLDTAPQAPPLRSFSVLSG